MGFTTPLACLLVVSWRAAEHGPRRRMSVPTMMGDLASWPTPRTPGNITSRRQPPRGVCHLRSVFLALLSVKHCTMHPDDVVQLQAETVFYCYLVVVVCAATGARTPPADGAWRAARPDRPGER